MSEVISPFKSLRAGSQVLFLFVILHTMWSDKSIQLVISGEYVCCSVVFGTLFGVFSVMWTELLMTSAISCPL